MSATGSDGLQGFVIYGLARSGTTYMQCALDAHPDVMCYGEVLRKPSQAAGYRRAAAVVALKACIRRPRTGVKVLAEQFVVHPDDTWLHGVSIIYVLRDPRDACLSACVANASRVWHVRRRRDAARMGAPRVLDMKMVASKVTNWNRYVAGLRHTRAATARLGLPSVVIDYSALADGPRRAFEFLGVRAAAVAPDMVSIHDCVPYSTYVRNYREVTAYIAANLDTDTGK